MPIKFRETNRLPAVKDGSNAVLTFGVLEVTKEVDAEQVVLDKDVKAIEAYRLFGATTGYGRLVAVDLIRGDDDFRVALYFSNEA